MRVLVVAEFYPRRADPVLGVWAHRQAIAARDAGAEVEVVVLYRPIPAAADARSLTAWRTAWAQPRRDTLDGIPVTYVRYLSPPRDRSYARWGSYASRPLGRALRKIRRRFPYDLIHAHYAVPVADAIFRTKPSVPVVISEHGGDIFHAARLPGGEQKVRAAFEKAQLVLPNSDGIERAVHMLGAERTRVVVLGADPPPRYEPSRPEHPTLVTVAHLIPRKRHADVLRAVWILRDDSPDLRYRIVGDGPSRKELETMTAELGLTDRVEFTGALPHEQALAASRGGTIFVMPSVDEALGVAYIEAMAAGRPAIGSRGEPGPEHLAAHTIGMRLVPPGEPEALATEIAELLEPRWGARVRHAARTAMAEEFTWEQCGAATFAAYEEALRDD